MTRELCPPQTDCMSTAGCGISSLEHWPGVLWDFTRLRVTSLLEVADCLGRWGETGTDARSPATYELIDKYPLISSCGSNRVRKGTCPVPAVGTSVTVGTSATRNCRPLERVGEGSRSSPAGTTCDSQCSSCLQ